MATQTQHRPGVMALTTNVPIVAHVITDDQIGPPQSEKLQPMSLHKVVKLLIDPHSAMLYDRHIHALKKVLKQYAAGFLMKDLVTIFKILNVCADRIENNPIYIEPMIDLLKLCRFSYLKEKSSDSTSFRQIAIESVSQLGYLMRVPNVDVRLEICQTLIKFHSEAPTGKSLHNLKPNSLSYNQNIVEESDVAETLVKSITLVENDLKVKIIVLVLLQKLSKYSVHNCKLMLKANAAQRICSRLMDYDATGQLLFRSCDILWNLLEYGEQEALAQQLNSLTCIAQLRDAFIYQLTQGYSHYDRQLRNDLLIIASLVAKRFHAPFVEAGFVKQLVLLATFQEVKSYHALVKHLKLDTNHEDFELKKLLINILVNLSSDPTVLQLLSEGKLLSALFSYVKSNEKTSSPRDWTVAQTEELQLHAMAALTTLGPIMMEDYMMCQGGTRLLLLLEWCTGSDDFHGQGNSFFGHGGRGNKRAQMGQCLRLMRSMVSTNNELILQDLVDQGAIHQLTAILTNMCPQIKTGMDEMDIQMQCDMVFILSTICDGDMHRKELFGKQGVDVLVTYLNMDMSLLSTGLGHYQLLLTTVDCIWCSIVGCFVTEDYFLECEGAFFLIDILEKYPKSMHNLALGCLLDLAENPKVIVHLNTWTGNKNISAAHLLCNIWREEEKDMGVPRENTGALIDKSMPLRGEVQKQAELISLPANCASQAIVDVPENKRAKLYALFCKLGFIDLPGLTTEDHVTLSIIENYLDFKMGEVWSEVFSELALESIRPITPDLEALEAITRCSEDRAASVLDMQQELLGAQLQQDLIDEQEFYAKIRDNHRKKKKVPTATLR